MDIYVVSPGDTVDRIAASYGVSPESIIENNQLVYPYALAIGQALLITFPGEIDISASSYGRLLDDPGICFPECPSYTYANSAGCFRTVQQQPDYLSCSK